MKLLVCGGRDYTDRAAFDAAMSKLPFTPTLVIEGGALGADRMGREWAQERGIHFATVPALWGHYAKGAGGKRNTAMLLIEPNYCVALPGGTGTADMVDKCLDAGIPVYAPYE